jgi:hypothetical protein
MWYEPGASVIAPVLKSHRILLPRCESTSVNTRVLKPGVIVLLSGENSLNTAYSCPCIVIYLSVEESPGGTTDRSHGREPVTMSTDSAAPEGVRFVTGVFRPSGARL